MKSRRLAAPAAAVLAAALSASALAVSASAPPPEDLPEGDVTLELGGRTRRAGNWQWGGWNGYRLSVSGGTLSVAGRMAPRHGDTFIGEGGTLRFEEGSVYVPGAGDANARTTRVGAGGTLDLRHGELAPFNARFVMEKGSTVVLGSSLRPTKFGNRWLANGGRLVVTGHVDFDMDEFRVADGATLELDVAEGKIADISKIVLGEGAKIRETGKGTAIRSHDDPRWEKCRTLRALEGLELRARGDGGNRCYCVYFDPAATAQVRRVAYKCPEFGIFTTRLPYFHMRYPAGADGPFEVKAVVEGVDGTRVKKTVKVPFCETPLAKPMENDRVLLGVVSYGPGRERWEMATNGLGNLYVRWGAWKQLLPENAGEDWMAEAERLGICSMTIYSSTPRDGRDAIKAAWGDRYLGNNVGERTGFLYGSRFEMKGPQDRNLEEAREWFMTSFFRGDRPPPSRGAGEDPRTFATSGAAFANYELPAGADFVCNELYAVGCANLTYATSEARGAARKWGPEWWSGWLAHEWQTFGIPYQSDDKYLSLEAGIKALYVMGTSLMCLESGSSGTQAHPHTWDADRAGYKYDDDPPRRYRETVRRCSGFIREHPRAKGTPETRIALALGENDGYIGQNRADIAPWAQHTNRIERLQEKVNVWSCSHPEFTWDRAREVFMPQSPAAGVSGTPWGLVDVVGVDSLTRLADIERYSLIVFGGWNTMAERTMSLLCGWMEAGGTCVMCLPQLLRRKDRDFLEYGAKDLLMPPGMAVEGFEESNGRMVAVLKPDAKNETMRLSGKGGRPLAVRRRFGKGALVLMLAKEFPGAHRPLGDAWKEVVASCAASVPQPATLEQTSKDDALRNFVFAAYGDRAYVLNLDMHRTRRTRLVLDGRGIDLELEPLEVREVPRGVRASGGSRSAR